MGLAILVIFSGLEQQSTCIVLLPQACLSAGAQAVIFYCMQVFVQDLARNLFSNSRAERNFTCFKAEM
jgi:hypothetical protein